jgi:phosphohistidine phosphatase
VNTMDLYLLRHAAAVRQGSSWAGNDADRPLTARGAKKMRRIAKTLKQREVAFDLILTSPFRRARETAGIVAGVLGIPDRITSSPHLKVGGSPARLVQFLLAHGGKHASVLLVGHEPFLSNFLSVLLSGKAGLAITMKKGGLCKLSVRSLRYGRCATLEWLTGPAQLLGLVYACATWILTAMS